MKKRTTAYFLVLVLIVTSLLGCSRKNNIRTDEQITPDKDTSVQEKGRYLEKKVDLPELKKSESILKILRNKEKKFEVYAYDEAKSLYNCYTQKDDMSWSRSEPGWLNQKDLKKVSLTSMCLGQDGNYYAGFTDYSTTKSFLVKSEDNGSRSKKVDLPYLLKPAKKVKKATYYPSVNGIQVLADGSLVLLDMWQGNNLLVFSPDGKQQDKIPADTQKNFTVTGSTVIAANESDSGIFLYDTQSKSTTKTYDYTYNDNGAAYALLDDQTLLVGDSAGIQRMIKDGTMWEKTVDGSLTSMSMPTTYIQDLFVGGESPEDYYGVFSDSGSGFKLLHFIFDKNVSAIPSNQLTVYSLKENKTLRQAISLYQGENPDTQINYVAAMGEEEGNVSDYIKALNTELLAGNGADIILLDGLPADSYIEKGVLADISDIIKPLADSGEILSNIAGGYETDGKIYQMPLRFSIPVIYGKKDALTHVSDLKDIVDYMKSSSVPYSGPLTYHQLTRSYLALYREEFLTDKRLSDDKFSAFLKNLKAVAENTGAAETMKDINNSNKNKLFWDSTTTFFGIKNGKFQAGMTQITNISSSMMLFALLKDTTLDYGSLNSTFLPSGMAGLNKSGKNQDAAKAFLKFLYSKEVQDADLYDGFPVNGASLKKWAEEDDKGISIATSDSDGNYFTAEWPGKEDRLRLYDTLQSLNKPIKINEELDNILTEQIIPYLKGDIDLNQAVSAVKTKVSTYLSE
ncbi:ABC transporter substrate-binding protein [Anaerocolumna jejuensis]|uniref:ABC transporter substrate-binding protein n=1 Tax=Anaerocolumna jejuensis TaxID=259063 RepID=UPI003F7CA7ED